MALLRFEGVSKRFHRGTEEVVALDEVDLSVESGEFVALIGPSGSGKSTLLHLAGGLDQPDGGRVLLGDRDLAGVSIGDRAKLRRREIGFVFQFFHLIPTLTVRENIELPLLLDGAKSNGRTSDLLDRVDLGHRATHLPGELSGGEMQRAAIARALVAGPQIILADEPTGNLDSATGATILGLLRELHAEERTTVLVITHDREIAASLPRRIDIRDGRIEPEAVAA